MSQAASLRLLLLLLALATLVFLALGFRSAVLEDRGRDAIARGVLSPAELQQALDDAHAARTLNAGNGPRVVEARLLVGAGSRPEEGIAVASEIVKDEPENLEAWAVLYIGAIGIGDEPLAERTLERIAELDPQLGERLRDRARGL